MAPCHFNDAGLAVNYFGNPREPLPLRAQPSLSAMVVGTLQSSVDRLSPAVHARLKPPTAETVDGATSAMPSTGPYPSYAIQAYQLRSNAEGVWLRLANPGLWDSEQVWCLQQDKAGPEALELLTSARAVALPRIEASVPADVMREFGGVGGEAAVPSDAQVATCLTPAPAHIIRAGPSLDAIQIGTIRRGQRLLYTEQVVNVDGTWLVLHAQSRNDLVEPNMRHLDAFTLLAPPGVDLSAGSDEACATAPAVAAASATSAAGGPRDAGCAPPAYFQLQADAKEEPVPAIYALLQHVPLPELRRRSFVLEYLSNQLMPLTPLLNLHRDGLQLLPTCASVTMTMGGRASGADDAPLPRRRQRSEPSIRSEAGGAADDYLGGMVVLSPNVGGATPLGGFPTAVEAAELGDSDVPRSEPGSPTSAKPAMPATVLAVAPTATTEPLELVQGLVMFPHKERALKAALQRTMSTANRVTITLNRMQIARTSEGLAGPRGRNSVFAQAARELASASGSDAAFLLPGRCWRTRLVNEGVDDAGGGYCEL